MAARILVVEDDGIVAMGLRARLHNLGYQTPAIVPFGEEAIQKARELRPDLVLMDIKLKGSMDGIEAAQRILEEQNIPVIYMTAYADDKTLERAKVTEPYGYILKPFEERELHSTIEMALYKHQMEQKLRDHERWLATTLRSIGDAVITTDNAGNITFMNPMAEKLSGWPLSEAMGQDLARVFTILQQEPHQAAGNPVARVLQNGLEPGASDDESVLVARDGTRLPVEHNVAPIRSDGDRTTGAVLVFRDISERKQAEAKLQQYTLELQARNEDLDAFAHTVAHNLKGILGRIIGFSEAVNQYHHTLSAEAVKEYLQTIARNGRKMGNVIDELLLLAGVRQEQVERDRVNMAHVVAEAQQRLADLVDEYQAEIITPDAWPAVWGYSPWVEEVWANYLSNGIKYGGRPPRLELGASPQADGMVRFWVRDNGVGVKPEDQDRLFRPFTQLGQVRATGHGLGLSIAQRIVEKLGGQTGIESEGIPGRGSVFSFTLPAVTEVSRENPQPAVQEAQPLLR